MVLEKFPLHAQHLSHQPIATLLGFLLALAREGGREGGKEGGKEGKVKREKRGERGKAGQVKERTEGGTYV